jgi:C-terminal peptidase prc
MTRRLSRLAWLLAAVLVVAGCSTASEDTTTSSGAPTPTTPPTSVSPTSVPPSTSPDSTAPPSTSTLPEVDFDTADCGELTGVLLCEAYELIQRHYVDPVTDEELVEGALAGIDPERVEPGDGVVRTCPLPADGFIEVCLAIDAGEYDFDSAEEAAVAGMASLALDPNSGYFDQGALALIQEEQSGQVEGIGALVATEEEGSDLTNSCQIITDTCRLRIVSTIEGSPARAAGLQEGDEFLAVDGQSIEGWTVDEVTAVVRGEAGTDVDLTFLREGEEFTVSITRAAVQVPVVQSEMVGEVAYLRLNIFTQNADEQLRGELGSLLYNNPEVLILDLRNNPGGLLDTAVEVTSEFLGEGLVVTTESPESTTPYVVEEGGIATDPELELYVLVNAGSASASEVVAGALADAGRATIVGENTFGKNTVQQRFPLSNGGALKLTIARWLTPNGNDFGGTGITPHVTADIPEELTATEIVSEVLGPMA